MICEKPDVARGLRQTKTVTDKEMVASNEARRRIKLRAMKEVRVKMGIKEKYDEKKYDVTKGRRKKGRANVKRCRTCVRKKVKKAQTCNSIKSSIGVQNRVTIWRTISSGRYTIKETTRVC